MNEIKIKDVTKKTGIHAIHLIISSKKGNISLIKFSKEFSRFQSYSYEIYSPVLIDGEIARFESFEDALNECKKLLK